MSKLRNLWSGDEERAINAPQPIRVARGWDVSPEVVPSKPQAPRRRKYVYAKPNKRDAVPAPHPGQSYNPCDGDHQLALRRAVKQLERKKRAHDKFAAMITLGRDKPVSGSLSCDKTWEEEVQEEPERKKKRGNVGQGNRACVEGARDDGKKSKKEDKGKKKQRNTKKEDRALQLATKRSLLHRRHPKRYIVVNEVDQIDEIVMAHEKTKAKKEAARERRRLKKREGMTIKAFGRYHYTPLALDVAPSSKLVGSLRHLNGSSIHPMLDRMKSLEERNLVPARMRHTYNKRKVLKPKGEVRIKRETFGILPETTF
uniref:Ribosome biogenesis protein NOP53 n=1 Tax=Trypanosoma congolense (strain IL3000) TaxID=1068625 RepID=F9WJ66_TRYCI|nr:unnamed protein product [Trypanosoma congolense IL3000]